MILSQEGGGACVVCDNGCIWLAVIRLSLRCEQCKLHNMLLDWIIVSILHCPAVIYLGNRVAMRTFLDSTFDLTFYIRSRLVFFCDDYSSYTAYYSDYCNLAFGWHL